jgi:hypothetical protein
MQIGNRVQRDGHKLPNAYRNEWHQLRRQQLGALSWDIARRLVAISRRTVTQLHIVVARLGSNS